jgi:RNA recognition motif-containing protein
LVGYIIYKNKKTMAKKLFVGGISFETTDETLKEMFAPIGTVESATVIIDKMSGRSKGFGFVEMSTEDEAKKAIETLNGKDVDGRNITVNEARPMEDRPRRDFGGSGRRYGGGDRRDFGSRGRRNSW